MIQLQRKSLKQALNLLSKLVPKRTTIPAVMNIRMRANGSVLFAATDLEMYAEIDLPRLSVGGDVEVTIPFSRFAAYLGQSKAEETTITVDEKPAAPPVINLDGTMRLISMPIADYPAIPETPKKAAVVLSAAEFVRAVKEADIAVSTEEVRYALTGLLLEAKGKRINFVSSDGKRLILVPVTGKTPSKEPVRYILNRSAVLLLAQMCAAAPKDADVEISFPNETTFAGKVGNMRMGGRLIDGNFPDYEAVIPVDRDKKVRIDRKALSEALAMVMLVTTDRTRAVKFTFTENKLTLRARTQDIGDATRQIPVEYVGEEISIVFNPDFVAEFLFAMPDDTIELQLKDYNTAGVWKGAKGVTHVLMPLTVNVEI